MDRGSRYTIAIYGSILVSYAAAPSAHEVSGKVRDNDAPRVIVYMPNYWEVGE